jgi:SAM-dependent methyltransferase
MAAPDSAISRAKRAVTYATSRLRGGPEERKAASYWGGLTDYHLSNDSDPIAIGRSRWLADSVVPALGLRSLLEVGTNSGRNLQYIAEANPGMDLKGIDVNPRAIEFALSKGLNIDFEIVDVNDWSEPPDRWDGALTMSVLDHIPDDAADRLAANIAVSARTVVSVELWDGSPGERGVYKYSRDTAALFARHGFEVVQWDVAPGQYDEERSLLWCYVGRGPADPRGA